MGKFNLNWLKYGALALRAILALLTYFLLRKEQKRETSQRHVESLIRIFMVLMVMSALVGFGLAQLDRQKVFDSQHSPQPTMKEPADPRAAMTGPEDASMDLSGIWKFEHFVREAVDSTGGLVQYKYDISGTLRLNQDLTGKILQSASQCSQSTLKAERLGSEVTLTSNAAPSKTNPCCAGLSYIFKGKILSRNQISWSFTPANLPRGNCRAGLGTSVWTRKTE